MISINQLKDVINEYLLKNQYSSAVKQLNKPIDYTIAQKPKRMRPLLCFMAANLNNNDYLEALPVAAAIEYFHNFTLLHDDIMDNADLRRNKPTAFKQFGLNSAILSGDFMMINAYQYLEELPDAAQLKCFKALNYAAAKVCEGQQLDINFETTTAVSEKKYLEMIAFKTAALIAASLKMGAIVANLHQNDTENLYQFGWQLGIAFQLLDDVLDVYGDTKKFGKKLAGDIVQNKKTYLLIKALELSQPTDKAELLNWFTKSDANEAEKIEAVIKLYNKVNIEAITRQKAKDYTEAAFSYLNNISAKLSGINYIKNYANQLLNRLT